MTARVLVEIAASIGKFEADFAKASKTADEHSKKIQKSIDDSKKKTEELGKALLGAFGISLGVEGIVRAFDTLIAKTIEGERSVNQFSAVLKATAQGVGLTTTQLDALGKSVADSSIFNPDQIRAATTALLRFRDIQGEVFKQALQQVPNVAAASGLDPTSAAQLIGRFLSSEATTAQAGARGLIALGVRMSQQQIDLAARMTETGDKAAAQSLKIDILNKSMGGAGEADTKGLLGTTTKLSKAWDELEKATGKKLFADNEGGISLLAKAFDGLAHYIGNTDLSLGHLIAHPAFAALNLLRGAVNATQNRGPSASGKINTKRRDELVAIQGELDATQKGIDAKRYEDLKLHLTKMGAAGATFYAGELQLQRSVIDLEQDALAAGYARGEVTAEDYYANQRRLSKASLDAVTDDLNHQIQAQRYIIGTTIPGTDKPLFDESVRADALTKQTGLINQANAARYAFFKEQQQSIEHETADVEKLSDAYSELLAKFEERSGRGADAAAIRYDASNRVLKRRIDAGLSSPDPSVRGDSQQALGFYNADRQNALSQADLNDKTKDFGLTLDAVSIKQSRIDLQFQQHTISELDALAQKSQANKDALPELQREIDAAQHVADMYEKGSLQARVAQGEVDKLRLKMEDLAASTDLVAKRFNDALGTAFENSFASFLDGTKSAKNAFKDFATSVLHDINSLVANQIRTLLFGGQGGGGGGGARPGSGSGGIPGGGGLIGALLNASAPAAGIESNSALSGLMGLFGKTSTGSGWTSSTSADWTGGYDLMPGFASGTDSAPGGLALVGEHGPEVRYIPRGAQIIPNHELTARREARTGPTGPSTTIVQNINVLPGATRQSGAQAAQEQMRALMQARANL